MAVVLLDVVGLGDGFTEGVIFAEGETLIEGETEPDADAEAETLVEGDADAVSVAVVEADALGKVEIPRSGLLIEVAELFEIMI